MKFVKWGMTELADCLKKRQMNKFDANIVLDGPRGNGKSTFVYKLFKRIGDFKPKEDIVFSREEVMDALENKKFGLIFADEMINSAHNRDFFSGDQKELIKMLNMYRDHHNIVAGCVPFFYDLDPQVRKFIVARITVVRRGLAIIQLTKTENLYGNDPWQTDINKKLEMKWVNQWKRGRKVNPHYELLTTFAGYIRYGPLQEKSEKIYTTIKEEKRSAIRKKFKEEEEKKKPVVVDIYKNFLDRIKKGHVTKRIIFEYSYLHGLNPLTVMSKINRRLRESGSTDSLAKILVENANREEPSIFKVPKKKPILPKII